MGQGGGGMKVEGLQEQVDLAMIEHARSYPHFLQPTHPS